MKEEDICSGCSKHIAYCMCCTGLSTDGPIISRPNPCNLAGKLRIIAIEERAKESQALTKDKFSQIMFRVREAAHQGKLSYSVWLADIEMSRVEANMIIPSLEKDGFKCSLELDAVTSWYSNTDWDTDDLLTISWE